MIRLFRDKIIGESGGDFTAEGLNSHLKSHAIVFADWCAQNYNQYELGKWENGLDDTFSTDELYDIWQSQQNNG